MKSLVAVLLVVACVASIPLSDNFLDQGWETYMKVFQKKYDTAEHEFVRRVIWEKNLQYVDQHNLEADIGLHTYWLGINQYADMESHEFVKRMNNLVPRNLTTYKPKLIFSNDNIKDIPGTVDWRDKGYVTEVKNQGQCGSWWVFPTTGSLEGQTFKKNGKLISLSEQNLIDCSQSYGNNGCEGGNIDNAFQYIMKFGIDSEASYPYEGIDGKCRYKKSEVAATCTGFVDVKSMSEKALQSAVAKVGPISVAIDAGHMSFQLYKHGVYIEESCSTTALDHGVLAVGYGTDNGQDYWLVKNSWGGSWGLKGYIKMARNHKNMCGIATQASYPTV